MSAEPSGLSAPAGVATVTCRRCGVESPAGTEACRCGAVLPGNQRALVHGGRSRLVPRLQADLREDIRQQVIAGLGGDEDALSTPLLRLVDRFAEVCLLADSYMTYLVDQGGPIGTRGRQRAAVAGYLAALDRQIKLSTLIGLERRPRSLRGVSVAESAAEFIRRGAK